MSDYHSCRRCVTMNNIRHDLADDVRKALKKLEKDPPPSEKARLKERLQQLKIRIQLNAKAIRDHVDEVQLVK